MPYFELPPYNEPFEDTEGRFPQLKQFAKFLENGSATFSRYWFARVLPERDGGNTEYLTIDTFSLKLCRQLPGIAERFIGVMIKP